MTFRFNEKPNSRATTIKPPSLTALYTAAGEHSDAAVRNYAKALTPPMWATDFGILYRQDIRVDPRGWSLYDVTVPYGPRKNESGDWTWDFDTTGGTVHIANSKETLASYKDPALAGNPPDHKTAIGVDGDEVKGTEIIIPAMKINVTYSHPLGIVTLPFAKSLHNITGTINSTEFLTFDPGEALFLGARGRDGTTAEAEVGYQFAMSANADNLSIGDIVNVVKRGWDAVWITFRPEVDGGKPVNKPAYAYVERVYEEVDLATALGFGG